MSYPYVQAAHDYGVAKGPRRAITWHMAEGGGTVGYLSRQNANGVSVHFVIEYTGRIVQMLHLTHANGSIRPTDIRTTDDPPYVWAGVPVVYGATAARDALGAWWKDPNSATIGVEIEGYAKDGPNTYQHLAMEALWTDLEHRYPGIRSLGHRDFADYKACPGHKLPWDRVGGHNLEEGSAMNPLLVTSLVPKLVELTKGDALVNPDGTALVAMSGPATILSPYESKIGSTLYRVLHVTTGGAQRLAMVKVSAVTLSDEPSAPADGFTQAEIDAARAAGVEAGAASEQERIALAEADRIRKV